MTAEKVARLLDLYSGAGGAATGYHRARFEVTGVDIKHQPRYPFAFHQGDALEFLRAHEHEFDAIHASPPCQRYSVASRSWNGDAGKHPDLLAATRTALQASGLPYVIENVVGAPLLDPVMLCGSMFDLRVYRHRLFECSFPLAVPAHRKHDALCYTRDKRKPHYGRLDEMTAMVQVTGGGNCSVKAARDAMAIHWMTKGELNEAIPPAYTQFIGAQLMRVLEWQEVAA